MGAQKEVWVVRFDVGSYRLCMGEDHARLSARGEPGATVHRYVLAREKREPIAWVVRQNNGMYLSYSCSVRDAGHFTSCSQLALAHRFTIRGEAEECAKQFSGRVVALVRKP